MSLIRLLLLIAIIYVVYQLARKLAAKYNSEGSKPVTTSMVRCEYCNVYIIRDAAYKKDNRFYCNQDHCEKALNNNSK